jgi:hypothetical protein
MVEIDIRRLQQEIQDRCGFAPALAALEDALKAVCHDPVQAEALWRRGPSKVEHAVATDVELADWLLGIPYVRLVEVAASIRAQERRASACVMQNHVGRLEQYERQLRAQRLAEVGADVVLERPVPPVPVEEAAWARWAYMPPQMLTDEPVMQAWLEEQRILGEEAAFDAGWTGAELTSLRQVPTVWVPGWSKDGEEAIVDRSVARLAGLDPDELGAGPVLTVWEWRVSKPAIAGTVPGMTEQTPEGETTEVSVETPAKDETTVEVTATDETAAQPEQGDGAAE